MKQLRETSGLSQFAAANRAGLDRTRLSLAENGHIKLNENEERVIRDVLLQAIQRRARQIEGVLANTKVKAAHAGAGA